jgi:hypothetical protein
MVMDMSRRIALIAGANIGVGGRTVIAPASDPHRLILAGRSIKLTKFAPDEIHNLGNPEAGAQAALRFIESTKRSHRGQFFTNSPPCSDLCYGTCRMPMKMPRERLSILSYGYGIL